MDHVLIKPTDPHSHSEESLCAICDGGLAVCKICGKAEAELDEPCERRSTRSGKAEYWYVAAMNDGLFIVNEKPRPAPVDYVNPSLPGPSLVIPMRGGGKELQELAEEIVAAHNARLTKSVNALLTTNDGKPLTETAGGDDDAQVKRDILTAIGNDQSPASLTTISAALMDVIDAGCHHADGLSHERRLTSANQDFASKQRCALVDQVLNRIIDLQGDRPRSAN